MEPTAVITMSSYIKPRDYRRNIYIEQETNWRGNTRLALKCDKKLSEREYSEFWKVRVKAQSFLYM